MSLVSRTDQGPHQGRLTPVMLSSADGAAVSVLPAAYETYNRLPVMLIKSGRCRFTISFSCGYAAARCRVGLMKQRRKSIPEPSEQQLTANWIIPLTFVNHLHLRVLRAAGEEGAQVMVPVD